MSFCARKIEPSWPVEIGRTRTWIAGYCVDWTGSIPPTEAEVLQAASPVPDARTALADWITSFMKEVDEANSLADLKARLKNLPSPRID